MIFNYFNLINKESKLKTKNICLFNTIIYIRYILAYL